MSFIIRHGDENDVKGIFRLVKELAEFERSPHAVVNTEHTLREDGFGKNPLYRVFVAEEVATNDIIGMALFFTAYSTWKGKMIYLDDLIVSERFRRFGIGTKLMNMVLKEAQHDGVNQVRWQVLDWNTPAIEFYKKMGVDFSPEWVNCSMSKQQLNDYLEKIGPLS